MMKNNQSRMDALADAATLASMAAETGRSPEVALAGTCGLWTGYYLMEGSNKAYRPALRAAHYAFEAVPGLRG